MNKNGNPNCWHIYFHRACFAKTEQKIARHLLEAVKSVPDSEAAITKEWYHGLALTMLTRRKKTNYPSLDIDFVVKMSGLDRMINPPKEPEKSDSFETINNPRDGCGSEGFLALENAMKDYLKRGLSIGSFTFTDIGFMQKTYISPFTGKIM